MTAPLRYASTFAGIGGFDVGFDRAGMVPTCQVEINPACRRVLAAHWPTVHRVGDIRDTTAFDLGRPDVVCGGFPCQDTSTAAPHRAGLDGARSHLFFDFARLLDEHARLIDATRPRWAVIENPAGLLTSNGGRDMATVAGTLGDLGYGWAYRLVDTGSTTPARRPRVLVVAHRGSDPRPAVQVLADTDSGSEDVGRPHEGRGITPRRPAPRDATRFDRDSDGLIVWRKGRRPRSSTDYATWVQDGQGNVLTGFDAGWGGRQTHLLAQDGRLRWPTLTEWERLQGLPDGWTAPAGSDSARFTALGNAMHAHGAYWLGCRLAAVDAALPLLPEPAVRP